MVLCQPPVTSAKIKSGRLKAYYFSDAVDIVLEEAKYGDHAVSLLTEVGDRAREILQQQDKDSAPVEVKHEAGVTLGDIIAALLERAERVEWLAWDRPESFQLYIEV